MNDIYYIGLSDKISIIKVELTVENNKIAIPKSKIAKTGIWDKSSDELMYLKSIHTMSVDLEVNKLIKIIKDMGDNLIYLVNLKSKEIVSKLINSNKIDNVFTKYVPGNALFIEELLNELSSISMGEYTELVLDEYFKSKLVLHPFIDTKQLFFYKDMPIGTYYSYSNKENLKKQKKENKEEEDSLDIQKTKIVLGKKSNTNIYTVYKIKEQVELDNLYKQYRSNLKNVDYYTIMLLYRLANSKNINYMNKNMLQYKEGPKRLEAPTGEILISEMMPAGISYYAFEKFYELEDILKAHIDKSNNVVNKSSIDITNMIYDDEHNILHDGNFTLEYKYKLNDKEYIIPVYAGLDLPTRNALKRYCKSKPKITLVILNHDDIYCRYYTILEMNDEYMLTANEPANIVLLENK